MYKSHFSETPILLGINEQSFWNVNTLESYLQTTVACVFLTETLIFKLKNPIIQSGFMTMLENKFCISINGVIKGRQPKRVNLNGELWIPVFTI